MDVDQPMTIVGQNEDMIVGFYEDARNDVTGELLFPGLEVSNVGSGLSGKRLNFVLPTGEAIFIDFNDVDFYAEDPYKNVIDRLNQVKDWYDQKDPITGKTNKEKSNLGVFKYLGQRSDRRADEGEASKFERTNINDINRELIDVGYKIVVNRDMGSAASDFGEDYLQTMWATINPAGLMGFKNLVTGEGASFFDVISNFTQYGETYTLIGPDGEPVVTSVDAGDIQNYLWNNLDKDDLNLLKSSASEDLNAQLEEQLLKEEETFNKQDRTKQLDILSDMIGADSYWKEMEVRILTPKSPLTAGYDQSQKKAIWDFISSTNTIDYYQVRSTKAALDTGFSDMYREDGSQILTNHGNNVHNDLKIRALMDLLDPKNSGILSGPTANNFYTTPKANEYRGEESRYHRVTTADFSILEKAGISREEVLGILQTLHTMGGDGAIISDADFLNERHNVAHTDYQGEIGILLSLIHI